MSTPTPESPITRRARELKEASSIPASKPSASKPIPYKAKLTNRRPLVLETKVLKPHPMLARVTMLTDLIQREAVAGNKDGAKRETRKDKSTDLTERLSVIRESIRTTGIRERLKVCKDAKGQWRIVDGRHRHIIAKELKIETLPCEEVPESEVGNTIMAMATSRPMSKGALAYLAILTHPEVVTNEKRSRGGIKSAVTALLTGEQLAAKTGVSPRTMDDAMWLYRTFQERDDAREKYEPSIWIGNGLDKIKAAVVSFLKGNVTASEEDEDVVDNSPSAVSFRRYLLRLDDVKKSWEDWKTLGEERQKLAVITTRKIIMDAPAEVRSALLKALTSEEK